MAIETKNTDGESRSRPVLAARANGRGTRTTKGAERAQQIMDIAQKMFHENGYAQTSMDDIAKATGLLKGSLYYYMDSKEDMLYWIVEDVHTVARMQLDEALSITDRSPLDRLLSFVEAQVDYLAHNVTRVAVYHHEWFRLEGERLREVRERRHDYNAALVGLVKEAQDAGEVNPSADTRLVANSILGVICWPYTWYRSSMATPRELTELCVEFVRGALVGLPKVPAKG